MVKEATISEHTLLITNFFTCTGVYELKWASQAISLQNTSSKISLRICHQNHRFYTAFIPLFDSTAKIIDFKRLHSEYQLHPTAARWQTCSARRGCPGPANHSENHPENPPTWQAQDLPGPVAFSFFPRRKRVVHPTEIARSPQVEDLSSPPGSCFE